MQQRVAQLEAENASLRALLEARAPPTRLPVVRSAAAAPDLGVSPREGGMTRIVAPGLRQERTTGGRPLLKGRVEDEDLSPHAPANGAGPPSTKSAFRLLVCNDDTCEVLVPAGPSAEIRRELSARSLIRLSWVYPPKTVLLVKKPNDDAAEDALCRIAAFLASEGLTVLVEPVVAKATMGAGGVASTWAPEEASTLGSRVDFCVSLGGDGTILWAAGLFRRAVPPVISYAMGSLGFLTPFLIEDCNRSLRHMLNGDVFVTLRARLACRILCGRANTSAKEDSPTWTESPQFTVLNEVVVDRGPAHSLVELDCYCDGMPMSRVYADGVIIATPTGSTAYSLAAGGSMVHPGISAMLLTPICAHALSSRPLLLPDGVELRIRVPDTSRCTAWVAFDGKNRTELHRGDTLCARVSPFPVPAVCSSTESEDWFRAAKIGLNWNQRAEQKPFVQLPRTYSEVGMISPMWTSRAPTPDA